MAKFNYQKLLVGPQVSLAENYGGLGKRYLDTLCSDLEKIHQIDTVTGITETNGSVRSRAIQLGQVLRHRGIVENDIILICSRCHADQTITVLACLLIGAIVAPIDPDLKNKECSGLVKQLKPKMCFGDLRALKLIERIVQETGMICKMVHFGDQLANAIGFQKLLISITTVKTMTGGEFKPAFIDSPRKRVAFIIPTQGTSHAPKLVCLSHHFILNQVTFFLGTLGDPEKIISFYSLAWVLQVILICLCFEAQIIRILTGPFTERNACKFIHDLKIDHVFLSTDLALKLIEHVAVRDFNLSCLKAVIVGSLATNPQDIKRLIMRLRRVKFTQMYISTETGIVTGCAPTDYEESLERIGTVGKIMQNCKVRIVDLDTREDVNPEVNGELLVGGDSLMLGYFKNSTLTKSSMEGEYFKTGDIAKFDGDGWFYIEGRIVDLVTINGERFSPRETEDIIMMHPFVRDAAIISNDREIIACVVIKPDTKLTEDKLLTFIKERLPNQTWPHKIIFLDNFPTTPVGKVKKDVLEEQFLKVRIEHSESLYDAIHQRSNSQ